MKIAVLIPYFGGFPKYAETFFWSAARNPNLDFFIFTDSRLPPHLPDPPPHVRLIPFSVESFNELASRKLNLSVAIDPGFAYKLCDFKPAYGVIFEDFIEGYDFFGWGDLDLVFGDSAAFLDKEYLDAFDIVSMRRLYISGSLTLVRNEERFRWLFKESVDHERVFLDSKNHYAFDETGPGLMRTLSDWRDVLRKDRQIDSFSHVAARGADSGGLRVDYSEKICENLKNDKVLKLENGELTDVASGQPYLYYHWVLTKPFFHFRYLDFNQLNEPLFITPYGFFTETQYANYRSHVLWRRFSGLHRKWFFHYPKRLLCKLDKAIRFYFFATRV